MKIMKYPHFLPAAIFFLLCNCFVFAACNNTMTDADIQQKINDDFTTDRAGAGLHATVNNGVATITGECSGDSCVEHITEKVKQIKGVKDVQTHIIAKP